MVFTKRLREGIRRGRIRCSVRIWKGPHVKAGGRYGMDEGHIVVDSIVPIELADITYDLARESGFDSVMDLLEIAKHGSGENVYLIRFHYLPPGAWDVGRRRLFVAGVEVARPRSAIFMNRTARGFGAASVALVFIAGAVAMMTAQNKPAEPLSIARQGYLFAGGKYSTVNGRQVMSGQLYAEFQIPARQSHPWPIVMIHGGAQSGTNFTGTPDGREGWAQFFLRQGYAIYVVDQPGRGRAAYQSDRYGPAAPLNLETTQRQFTAPERANRWPQAKLHTQWPGQGVSGDPVFDQFYASQMPVDSGLHAAAGTEPGCDHRAAREDRAVDSADAFAIGRIRLARCGRASGPGEGHPGRRAQRAAVLQRRQRGGA